MEQIVTPWEVNSSVGIDYNKIIVQFGASVINDKLIQRWKTVTGMEAHIWMKRGLFFAHRDLDKY